MGLFEDDIDKELYSRKLFFVFRVLEIFDLVLKGREGILGLGKILSEVMKIWMSKNVF